MTHRLVVSILLMAMLACFPLIFVCVFFVVRSYFPFLSLFVQFAKDTSFDYNICLACFTCTHTYSKTILVRPQYWQLLLELFQFQVVREAGPRQLLPHYCCWLCSGWPTCYYCVFMYVQVCIHVWCCDSVFVGMCILANINLFMSVQVLAFLSVCLNVCMCISVPVCGLF